MNKLKELELKKETIDANIKALYNNNQRKIEGQYFDVGTYLAKDGELRLTLSNKNGYTTTIYYASIDELISKLQQMKTTVECSK